MIKELRYAWRRLRGQCLVCKKKRERHKDCYHCNISNLYCHFCNKRLAFARAYG